MSNICKFVNAIFQLKTKGEYKLYSGPLEGGGITEVSIVCKRSEGYSQNFYEIKQIIARPNKQASIQKFGLPSMEFVYKLIQDAIKENNNEFNNLPGTSSKIITPQENNSSNNYSADWKSDCSEYVEVIESSESNPERTKSDKENSTVKGFDFEAELEKESQPRVKFANLPHNNNEQKSMGIRNSVLKNLDSPF